MVHTETKLTPRQRLKELFLFMHKRSTTPSHFIARWLWLGQMQGHLKIGLNQNSTERGTAQEPNSKYHHLNWSLTLSIACTSSSRFRSRLPRSTGFGWWPDIAMKRRIMSARFCHFSLIICASVDRSPAPEKPGIASIDLRINNQN